MKDNNDNEGLVALAGMAVLTAAIWTGIEFFSGKSNETEAERLYQEGIQQYSKGAYNEAIKYSLEAIKKNPNHAGAYNQIAWIYALNNFELEQALRYAQKAISLAKTPNDQANFRDTLADIYARLGDFDRAIVEFKTCLQIVPDFDEGFPDNSASYRLGLCYQAKQDLGNAYLYMQQALRVNPKNPFIYSATGDISLALGNYHDAIACYNKATTLISTWSLPNEYRQYWKSAWLCNNGVAYYHLEDYKASQQMNESAYQAFPTNPYPIINLAALAGRNQEKNKMRLFLEKGIPLLNPQQNSDLIVFMLTHPNFDEYREIVLDLLKSHGKISQLEYSQRKKSLSESRSRQTQSPTIVYQPTTINGNVGAILSGNNASVKNINTGTSNQSL